MKRGNAKRIIALAGVILLGIMIVATLVVACIKFPGSDKVFSGLMCMDIAVPVLLWMYLYLYKRAHAKDMEQEEEAAKEELARDNEDSLK